MTETGTGPDELLGTREAARRLGVHENTVRNYADRGILPVAQKLPGSRYRRFRARDVEDLRCTMKDAGGHSSQLAGSRAVNGT